jgi:hypothetical protein
MPRKRAKSAEMKRLNVQRASLNFQRPKPRPFAAAHRLNIERWQLDVERFSFSFVFFAPFRGQTSP